MHPLDLIDLDEIYHRVAEADNLRDVAAWCGCTYSVLWRYLHGTPEREKRLEQALSESSEALLQRGRDVLEKALMRESGIDPQAAKALAAEYGRLAGYRNAKYSDKGPTVNVQVNNSNAPLALPANLDPIAASKAYGELIEGKVLSSRTD